MPASTITVAQWVRRTIQWWRRTNGRGFCALVTIGSVTLPRYGRTGGRVRGDEGILTNVQRLPRQPCPALVCRPDDPCPTLARPPSPSGSEGSSPLPPIFRGAGTATHGR